MSFSIKPWEIAETVVVQRIIRALKHSDAEIIKSELGEYIQYAIQYKNNYFKLHASREELADVYSATKKYNDLSDVRVKIMAIILGYMERVDND